MVPDPHVSPRGSEVQRWLVPGRPGCRVSYPSLIGRWPDRPLWETDRETHTFGRGVREARRDGQRQGPRDRQGERRRAAQSWKDCRAGWLGPDSGVAS